MSSSFESKSRVLRTWKKLPEKFEVFKKKNLFEVSHTRKTCRDHCISEQSVGAGPSLDYRKDLISTMSKEGEG